jgi:hypothetical protein
MANIFIAINGDDVGSRIGDAIANDDHEGLAQASSSIQGAHDTVDQWVDSVGGKKISSAGDDAIYMVPDNAVNDLDDVRSQYKEESGHGLTVGVGASMSQASKALIYGKLNGKDQTIHYEPMIEDYLSDEDEDQPEVPGEDDLQDQADQDIEADAGAADLENAPEDTDEDVDDSQSAVPGAAAPQDPAAEMADPQMSEQDDSEIPEAGSEDDIAEDDQAATDAPTEPAINPTTAQKNNKAPQANTPPIDGKTDVDFGTSDEDTQEDPADPQAEMSGDEDMPDTDPETDSAAEMADSSDDSEMPMDADQADGEEMQDPSMEDDTQELGDEDVADPSQQDDGEDPVASMIHGDMQDGGDDQDADMDADQADGDAALDEELKSDIANALLAFKENKHMLEDARDTNPALYEATITMLRSMISMAKKLGFTPEQDMADQEANAGMEEGFPEAGAEDMGEDPTEDMPNEEEGEDETLEDAGQEAPSDKKGPPPPKK